MDNRIENLAKEIANGRLAFTIERAVDEYFELNFYVELAKAVGKRFIGKPFIVDEENRFVLENCLKWLCGREFNATDPDTGEQVAGDLTKGLYIAGPCGTGKTILLDIIAGMASRLQTKYKYGNDEIKLQWKSQRAEDICNAFITGGVEAVENAKNADVLCINDFGSETPEQLYMGNRMNVMRQIIETRGDRFGQFTIITSNFGINDEDITRIYGDRVASRLQRMCNYFELMGKDRRKF